MGSEECEYYLFLRPVRIVAYLALPESRQAFRCCALSAREFQDCNINFGMGGRLRKIELVKFIRRQQPFRQTSNRTSRRYGANEDSLHATEARSAKKSHRAENGRQAGTHDGESPNNSPPIERQQGANTFIGSV